MLGGLSVIACKAEDLVVVLVINNLGVFLFCVVILGGFEGFERTPYRTEVDNKLGYHITKFYSLELDINDGVAKIGGL